MNQDLNVDSILDGWFTEGPTRLPDRSVEAIVGRLDGTPQRRPIASLGGVQLDRYALALVGVAAVAAAAVLAANLVSNRQGGVGGPLGSPSSSASGSVAPSPTPRRSLDLGSSQPVAGRIGCGNQGLIPLRATLLDCSGDGTRVLVLNSNLDLLVVHADGSETQVAQLSQLEAYRGSSRPVGATISPDGTRVIFAGLTTAGLSCHNGALFGVDVGAGLPEVLWESERDGIVSYPTFSPDGTRIAFADSYCDHDHNVWVMNADGTDPRQIVGPFGAGRVHGVAWSAAGDRIALSYSGVPDSLGSGILTFAPDGSDFRQVSGADEFCWPGRRC
jgi:hypothetical protein